MSILQNRQTEDSNVETIENIDTEISDSTNLNIDTNSNKLQNDVTKIGIPLAFAAGLLSFLSPCILPLILSVLSRNICYTLLLGNSKECCYIICGINEIWKR